MQLFNDVTAKLPDSQLWTKGDFRANYLTIDFETTGFSSVINRITQIGCLLTTNGQTALDKAKSQYVKTPYNPVTWSAVYAGRDSKSMQLLTLLRKAGCDLDSCKQAIDANDGSIQGLECIPEDIKNMREANGRLRFIAPVDVTHIRSETCEREGAERREAMTRFAAVVNMVMDRGWPIVGHNIVSLDLPFLEYEVQNFAQVELRLNHDLVIDTGMIVKGDQCGSKLTRKETLPAFYKKVGDRRSKVKWTLDEYCVPTFELDKKYGVDVTKQHESAGYDCWVTDCLVRELL